MLGRHVDQGLLAHPDPPEKIGQVRHCGQDYPGDVVESETALMKGIRMARENAEQLYQYVSSGRRRDDCVRRCALRANP